MLHTKKNYSKQLVIFRPIQVAFGNRQLTSICVLTFVFMLLLANLALFFTSGFSLSKGIGQILFLFIPL